MSYRLNPGDRVRVRLEGDANWTQAVVALASATDPSSVMLQFEGAVRAAGGFLFGGLPLTIDYTAESVTSLIGESYEIEVAGAPGENLH